MGGMAVSGPSPIAMAASFDTLTVWETASTSAAIRVLNETSGRVGWRVTRGAGCVVLSWSLALVHRSVPPRVGSRRHCVSGQHFCVPGYEEASTLQVST